MKVKNIKIAKEKIAEFCDRWQITEFALFGSVLRDDFRPDSDIDVLVTWDPNFHFTLSNLDRMESELEAIFDRKVDLVSKRAIQQSLNYLRSKAILSSSEVIYARTRSSFPVRHSHICETSFELCIGKNLERIPGGCSISRCCDSAN
ncbi:MAG: nucleotidyltransferase family protein [Hormoscilla sp. GM102CHS1]|nr:nucleotidyltransferase family protein [Hormoscilla sp. GM102CHS1]